jgi:hypothetical protein
MRQRQLKPRDELTPSLALVSDTSQDADGYPTTGAVRYLLVLILLLHCAR